MGANPYRRAHCAWHPSRWNQGTLGWIAAAEKIQNSVSCGEPPEVPRISLAFSGTVGSIWPVASVLIYRLSNVAWLRHQHLPRTLAAAGEYSRNYPDRLLTISRTPMSTLWLSVQRSGNAPLSSEFLQTVSSSATSASIRPIFRSRENPSTNAADASCLSESRRKKGGEILIRAYARVRVPFPDAELVMVGDGPLTQRLKELAQQLNVPVEFTGSLPSTEVKKHIDEARVFCLPSGSRWDAEGMGGDPDAGLWRTGRDFARAALPKASTRA